MGSVRFRFVWVRLFIVGLSLRQTKPSAALMHALAGIPPQYTTCVFDPQWYGTKAGQRNMNIDFVRGTE